MVVNHVPGGMHWLHRTHDSAPRKPDGIPGPNSIDNLWRIPCPTR